MKPAQASRRAAPKVKPLKSSRPHQLLLSTRRWASWRLWLAVTICLVLVGILRHILQSETPQRNPLELAIWWHAPFFSPSGYGSEAVAFSVPLDRRWKAGVWVSQHGDTQSEEVFRGFSPEVQQAMLRMATQPRHRRPADAIIICHSEPGAWSVPKALYRTTPCPPEPVEQVPYVIGRTMFESDRVSEEHARRMNAMDEVWVPSEWQREVFAKWGVAPRKLHVMPEAVDSAAFDPALHQALPLPIGKLVFGPARAKHGGSIAGSNSSKRFKKYVQGISWRRQLLRGLGTAGGTDVEEYAEGAAIDAVPGGKGSAGAEATANVGATADAQQQQHQQQSDERGPFVFLSSFKWEARKGWDILLQAFLTEFSAADDVMLVLMTKPFYTDTNFAQKMQRWVEEHLLKGQGTESGGLTKVLRIKGKGGAGGSLLSRGPRSLQGRGTAGEAEPAGRSGSSTSASALEAQLPTVYVVHDFLPSADLPRLYKAADCFVIPSRGEGWGRPHVEAMSMALPLIATNWSGVTAYLDESVGYPLHVDGLVDTPPDSGPFVGHKWAQPSVQHLRQLMRHVVTHQEEAAELGRAARQRMVERYSPDVVAQLVVDRLSHVRPRTLGQ